MTIKAKVEAKHKRLSYNINLLAQFIDIYKDNSYLLASSSNQYELSEIYEKSYWIMLDFNIFIGNYFTDGSRNFYKEDRMQFYDSKNAILEESIKYCANLMISRLILLIEGTIRKYKDELLQDTIDDINQAEVIKKIKFFKNFNKNLKSQEDKLDAVSYLINIYNKYLENEPYLMELKASNRKRNWIIPSVITLAGGIIMMGLGIWLGTLINNNNETNLKSIIFSIINKKEESNRTIQLESSSENSKIKTQ